MRGEGGASACAWWGRARGADVRKKCACAGRHRARATPNITQYEYRARVHASHQLRYDRNFKQRSGWTPCAPAHSGLTPGLRPRTPRPAPRRGIGFSPQTRGRGLTRTRPSGREAGREVGRRPRMQRARGGSTGVWVQGTGRVHLEHFLHGRDARRVEAQRLVERLSFLPSRKEGDTVRGEVWGKVRAGSLEGGGVQRRKQRARGRAPKVDVGEGHAWSARRTCSPWS